MSTTEQAVTVAQVEPLSLRLAVAEVASCSCNTKTDDLRFHDGRCLYRVLRDAQAALASVSSASAEKGRSIYVASRASIPERGAMWREWRAKGVPINSTWIDEDGPKASRDLAGLWDRIRLEVTSAERLVLYVEPDDFPLKGAFIEVGMALAANVPVMVVAPGVHIEPRNYRPLGSWMHSPLVSRFDTVAEAFGYRLPAASPEPVPATNQAGEVDERKADAWNEFFDAHLTDGNDGYSAASVVQRCREAFEAAWPKGWEAAFAAAFAALATQPATSQEGERETVARIIDRDAWSATKPNRYKVRQREALEKADQILALAATPTPPTLSEDLREALSDQLDDVDERLRNGAVACSVMLGKPQSEWLRAALVHAQVKAS